jgi:hypothetical protein
MGNVLVLELTVSTFYLIIRLRKDTGITSTDCSFRTSIEVPARPKLQECPTEILCFKYSKVKKETVVYRLVDVPVYSGTAHEVSVISLVENDQGVDLIGRLRTTLTETCELFIAMLRHCPMTMTPGSLAAGRRASTATEPGGTWRNVSANASADWIGSQRTGGTSSAEEGHKRLHIVGTPHRRADATALSYRPLKVL